MSTDSALSLKKKIKFLYAACFMFAILLIMSAFRWQVVESARLKGIANNRVTSSELTALRGSIYSKDGVTLAYSEPRFNVFVWIKDLEYFEDRELQTREEFIRKIAPLVDSNYETLNNYINSQVEQGVLWIKIADSIDTKAWTELKSLKTDKDDARSLRGLSFQYTSERVYPENRLASHVIGLTEKDKDELKGQGGIEGALNGDLNPRKGFEIRETDAIGQAVAKDLFLTVEPKPGSSVYLTIDTQLQHIVEDQVKANVERFQAKSGNIIIMDPKTGDIMAMANYPDYDPNLREETDPGVYTNSSISIPYEIGSIGKIFTLSTTIDLNMVTPDTVLLPEGHQGCEEISKDLLPLCTWDKSPQPPMPAWQCFVKSDNLCFYHMALTFGYEVGSEGYKYIKPENYTQFYEYLKNYGVGSPTGIELTGEDQGTIKDPEEWTLGDVAAFSYGHGYAMTPIQAISAVSAIPNYGVRMRPTVIDKIVKGDGKVIEYVPQPFSSEERIISVDTANTMAEIMHTTFLSDASSGYRHLQDYYIGMKSGTALIVDKGVYKDEVNNTQVGFDLSPQRKFIMLVKLEEPQGQKLSFYNTRIMWMETFDRVKDYLNVPKKSDL